MLTSLYIRVEKCKAVFTKAISLQFRNNWIMKDAVNGCSQLFHSIMVDEKRSFLKKLRTNYNTLKLWSDVEQFYCTCWCVFNILINSCKSLQKAERVLSSAKLCKSAGLNQRNRSLIKMLKRIWPNMEPWGIPESNSLKKLYVLLILTFCLRRFI